MTTQEKNTLLALIEGLTQKQGATQYDSGTEVIKGENLELLIDFIEKM